MCGSVGMFLGCDQIAACPLSTLLSERAGGPTAYDSAFDRWDQRASVRRQPRRRIAPGGEDYFPLELMPVAGHPLVRDLAPARLARLRLRHLQRYLRFTVELETRYVNPVVLAVGSHGFGIALPPGMRLDAMRIYTDEAYHALVATDLLIQSEAASGIQERRRPPGFMAAFDKLARSAPPELAGLLPLLFVIVSESLITATLSELPRSDGVLAGVSDAVRDHAADEARHHRYFSTLLGLVWHAMSVTQRAAAGPLVPTLIDIFLRPDAGDIATDLREAGLSGPDAALVIDEALGAPRVERQRRRVAGSALRAFEAAGVLADPALRAVFEDAGLS